MKVPRLFVNGRYIGGEPEIQRLHESGELARVLADEEDMPADQPEMSLKDEHGPSLP